MGFLFFLQIAFLKYTSVYYVYPDDASIKEKGIINVDNNDYIYFFSWHVFTFRCFNFVYSIFGFVGDYWKTVQTFMIICADIGIVFAYLTAKEIFNKKTANIAFVLMLFAVGLNMQMLGHPDTSTFFIMFISVTVWFFVRLLNSSKKLFYTVALAISCGIGYLVRPNMIIFVVCITIAFILNRKFAPPPPIQQPSLKKRRTVILCLAATFVFCGIVGGYNGVFVPRLYGDYYYGIQPMTEYQISVGAVGDVNEWHKIQVEKYPDYYWPMTTVEKRKICNEITLQMFQDRGVFGTAKFYVGKFFTKVLKDKHTYMIFHSGIKNYESETFLSKFYYGDAFEYIKTGFFYLIFFGTVFGIIALFEKRSVISIFLQLYPLLLLASIIVMETKSIYFVGSLPILCIIAAKGALPFKP
jgi:asparagine N-glycosylation enzyme membrane subunit Stt3